MSLFRTALAYALLAAGFVVAVAGCRSPGNHLGAAQPSAAPSDTTSARVPAASAGDAIPGARSSERSAVRVVGYEDEEPVAGTAHYVADPEDPFAGAAQLSLEPLVEAVQQRNPTIQASAAAWAAAVERSPQVSALEDPMLQSMAAPGSFPSSSNINSSYYVGIAQRVPWWGKRELRGRQAQSESNAAAWDIQDARLRLEEVTRVAYFDYYLATREIELNAANLTAVEEFRRTAISKYESNQVPQQDVLQSDVELAKLETRRIELEQNRRIAMARINTLLHRAPDYRLPPPPASIPVAQGLPAAAALQQLATEQRPDLAARASRIQAEQTAVELAGKEFYPDFEFMGRYDQFWFDVEQRPQVGMNMNIPLNQTRRKAAVREAMFRLSKLQAEYAQDIDSIHLDVQSGLARLEASLATVRLYAERILPAARANVESASAGYVAGTIDFLRLIEAQRELIELQEKQQEAIADFHRRRAELERVVGASWSNALTPREPTQLDSLKSDLEVSDDAAVLETR